MATKATAEVSVEEPLAQVEVASSGEQLAQAVAQSKAPKEAYVTDLTNAKSVEMIGGTTVVSW